MRGRFDDSPTPLGVCSHDQLYTIWTVRATLKGETKGLVRAGPEAAWRNTRFKHAHDDPVIMKLCSVGLYLYISRAASTPAITFVDSTLPYSAKTPGMETETLMAGASGWL